MQDVKPFNVGYAMLEDYLDTNIYPASLSLHESQSLAEALAAQNITPETHMLAFEHEGRLQAFPMRVVVCYNVIQFESESSNWMLTFCNACNAGMVFDPMMDGTTLHFRRRGAYDGILLIWDTETKSYWQHITGECLYGTSAEKRLTQLTGTRHMSAAEVIAQDASARLYTVQLTPEQEKLTGAMEKMRTNPERVGERIASTFQQEDTRRQRFELGLGIWNSRRGYFIPLLEIAERDNIVMTEFEGRKMVVYHTQDALSPVAVYVDTPIETWNHESVRLTNGDAIKDNQYHMADGTVSQLNTPIQFLMRWYGFASTFPDCEIYKAE